MRTTDEIYTVNCGSSVAHQICFECEGEWRSKMPLQDGMRTMTCPTCRQSERERPVESLTRELIRVNTQDHVTECVERIIAHFASLYGDDTANVMRATLSMLATTSEPIVYTSVPRTREPSVPRTREPSVPRTRERTRERRPTVMLCASGRDCRTRSVLTTRTKTHMKCRQCTLVACCRNCKTCITC